MLIEIRNSGLPMVFLVLGCLFAPTVPARAADTEETYQQFCASCHGEDGTGNGPAAFVLEKPPQDFSDCKAMASKSTEYLVKIITEGGAAVGKSVQMPASGKNLSAQQIAELADFIAHNFCEED